MNAIMTILITLLIIIFAIFSTVDFRHWENPYQTVTDNYARISVNAKEGRTFVSNISKEPIKVKAVLMGVNGEKTIWFKDIKPGHVSVRDEAYNGIEVGYYILNQAGGNIGWLKTYWKAQ